MILKKRMEPIFASLGINLVVHNIAQGANNCNPYDLCYESMGTLRANSMPYTRMHLLTLYSA
jgi:hypothetical protein